MDSYIFCHVIFHLRMEHVGTEFEIEISYRFRLIVLNSFIKFKRVSSRFLSKILISVVFCLLKCLSEFLSHSSHPEKMIRFPLNYSVKA